MSQRAADRWFKFSSSLFTKHQFWTWHSLHWRPMGFNLLSGKWLGRPPWQQSTPDVRRTLFSSLSITVNYFFYEVLIWRIDNVPLRSTTSIVQCQSFYHLVDCWLAYAYAAVLLPQAWHCMALEAVCAQGHAWIVNVVYVVRLSNPSDTPKVRWQIEKLR